MPSTRKPLIVNASANQIQELPAGDSVDGIATLTATTLVGNGVVPIGGIIMWSGTIASLASSAPNFKLCDGSNGTPDLTNRFVIGANADDGGKATTNIETGTYSGSNIAKQSGGFKNSVLHTHEHKYAFAQGDGGGISNTNNGSSGITNVTSFGGSLSELEQGGSDDGQNLQGFTAESEEVGVNQAGGDSNSQTGCDANLPPYFALAYIMRVS
tara:strand:+ start:113 stop:751 length:639 start_codon:yes stop_codon:yes gene_type:complete